MASSVCSVTMFRIIAHARSPLSLSPVAVGTPDRAHWDRLAVAFLPKNQGTTVFTETSWRIIFGGVILGWIQQTLHFLRMHSLGLFQHFLGRCKVFLDSVPFCRKFVSLFGPFCPLCDMFAIPIWFCYRSQNKVRMTASSHHKASCRECLRFDIRVTLQTPRRDACHMLSTRVAIPTPKSASHVAVFLLSEHTVTIVVPDPCFL